MAGELDATKQATQSFTCSRCGGTFHEPRRAGRPRTVCASCFGTPAADMQICVRCGDEKRVAEFGRDPSKANGLRSYCRSCDREKANGWCRENRERKREASREWYANNRDRFRDYDLKRNYGITAVEYDQILLTQAGRCAICRTDDPGARRFHVDHDHETDAVRGLLCSRCNTALGLFREDPSVMAAAIAYLEEATCQGS